MSPWAWQDRAACRGMDLALFFPVGDQDPVPEALAACARCPVWRDCLSAAQEHRLEGVWGGMTERERASERRRQGRAQLAAQRRGEAA